MRKSGRQSFVGGVATLTIAVAIVKVLGALYKIPLGNLIGPDGMGYFNSAYSVYNLLLTVSTAGLPVALSKMIAEANTLGQQNHKRNIFRISCIAFVVLGLFGTLIMAVWPQELAARIGHADSWYCVLILAPAVIGVCGESAFRGYSQGHGNMVPTAVSQVIEAASKLVLGIAVAMWMMGAGYTIAQSAGGAIVGITLGSFLGTGYLAVNYLRAKRRNEAQPAQDLPPQSNVILARMAKLALPIMLSSAIMPIITLIDQMLIFSRLQNAVGYTENYTNELFGVYGSALTLFNLPAALIVPITTAVIPALAAAIVRRDHGGTMKLINTSMRLTVLLALPMGVGLTVLAKPILQLCYPAQPDMAKYGASLLTVLGIVSILVELMMITNAYLQAYGRVKIPLYTMLAGGIVKVVTDWVLLGIPEININGAPISSLCCYITIVVLNLIIVGRMLPDRMQVGAVFLKPLFVSAVMGAAAWGTHGLFYRVAIALFGEGRVTMTNVTAAAGAILVAVVLYCVLLIALRIITKEDASLLPKGEKIARLLRLK